MNEAGISIACARVHKELAKIAKVVERIDNGLDLASVLREDDREDERTFIVEAIALNMHDFYTGCEKMFVEIAKNVDRLVPSGTGWHRALIDQMNTDIPSVRPSVISDGTYNLLNEYLGFRHVLRNTYAYQLNDKRTLELATGARKTFEVVAEELGAFCEFGAAASEY